MTTFSFLTAMPQAVRVSNIKDRKLRDVELNTLVASMRSGYLNGELPEHVMQVLDVLKAGHEDSFIHLTTTPETVDITMISKLNFNAATRYIIAEYEMWRLNVISFECYEGCADQARPLSTQMKQFVETIETPLPFGGMPFKEIWELIYDLRQAVIEFQKVYEYFTR